MNHLFKRVQLSVSVSVVITLCAGLALTALLFASARKVESDTANERFQHSARLGAAAMAGGMGDAVERLTIINEIFCNVAVLSSDQFRRFSAPILARYPAIQALSFQRVVSLAERPAFEAKMRLRHPGFTISELDGSTLRPAAPRDFYNVVSYIEPMAGNEAAFGLDTGMLVDQAAARRRAHLTGRVSATGLLSLTQHQGRHGGVLLIAPVYWQGAPRDTPSQRERAVIGETAAVYRVERLVASLLADGGLLDLPGLSIAVYASATPDPAQIATPYSAHCERS